MFRPFTLTLALVAAIGLSMVFADQAQARHRRCGGSDGGSGSYGSHGGFGGGGSSGGLFSSRRGDRCGNESYGSAGGHGSCGSHGGSYYRGDEEGRREYGTSRRDRRFDPGEAPPAPPSNFDYSDDNDRNRDNDRSADDAENRDKVDAAAGNDQDNI
jgi:hypothetical protein